MADGYARLSGKPQCVIVHVDVGTQGLGAAIHNASCGRAPILIFAGLSPYTIEGELRGSRTEYIHWIQDVPDQKQIVSQYCRFTGEIKTGRNVKQLVRRALQFATSDPQGPVYLYGAREAMEEDIEPYNLKPGCWDGVGPAALPDAAVKVIAEALVQAKEPLLIAGYSGRNHAAVPVLVALAEKVKGLRVLDTGGSDLCFPFHHRSSLGTRYGISPHITTADVILVLDCDVPWIPVHNRPSEKARIFHIDVDPLKQQMPVFYIEAEGRWKADSFTALSQLVSYIETTGPLLTALESSTYQERWKKLGSEHEAKLQELEEAAKPAEDGTLTCAYLISQVRKAVPEDTIFAIEAVTNTVIVADHLQVSKPGHWINCGGGGLGWSGGGALGIYLAASQLSTSSPSSVSSSRPFITQIIGDGTYLFSVPSSVYWISSRYQIPILTIILNNVGWNAPRKSLELVHPHGLGSKVSNKEIHISFDPTPDYAGIAVAAAGGKIWGGKASSVEELKERLREAVDAVRSGRSAVLDAQLGGAVGKFGGYGDQEVKGEVKDGETDNNEGVKLDTGAKVEEEATGGEGAGSEAKDETTANTDADTTTKETTNTQAESSDPSYASRIIDSISQISRGGSKTQPQDQHQSQLPDQEKDQEKPEDIAASNAAA